MPTGLLPRRRRRAARDAVEYILKAQGKWKKVVGTTYQNEAGEKRHLVFELDLAQDWRTTRTKKWKRSQQGRFG